MHCIFKVLQSCSFQRSLLCETQSLLIIIILLQSLTIGEVETDVLNFRGSEENLAFKRNQGQHHLKIEENNANGTQKRIKMFYFNLQDLFVFLTNLITITITNYYFFCCVFFDPLFIQQSLTKYVTDSYDMKILTAFAKY